MPIYEFKCVHCGAKRDEFYTTIYDPLKYPECCTKPMKRLMSRVNSNFRAWSDAMDENLRYSMEPAENVELLD